ncbi:hypothetical protein Q3G72_012339 [Acer saccharum]|nr:hypothetical protein Q3G72_012339 [Acer saccharum]
MIHLLKSEASTHWSSSSQIRSPIGLHLLHLPRFQFFIHGHLGILKPPPTQFLCVPFSNPKFSLVFNLVFSFRTSSEQWSQSPKIFLLLAHTQPPAEMSFEQWLSLCGFLWAVGMGNREEHPSTLTPCSSDPPSTEFNEDRPNPQETEDCSSGTC